MRHFDLKTLLMTSLFIAGVFMAYGQTRFQTTFGGGAVEALVADFSQPLLQTEEGTFVTVGATNSFGDGDFDIVVSETDSMGNHLWSKTYGTDSTEAHSAISEAEDGYLIAGRTEISDSVVQGYLLKIDKEGNEMWSKAYTGNVASVADNIKPTSDGGMMVVGTTLSNAQTSTNVHVMKFDENQEIEWEQVIGPDGEDFIGWDFEEVQDGYIIAGQIGEIGSNSDGMVLKIGENGAVEWGKEYTEPNTLMAFKDLIVDEENLYLTGLVEGPIVNAPLVVKTNRDGSLVWARNISFALRAVNASLAENGELSIYGIRNTNPGGAANVDFLLCRMDSSGQGLSSMSYGDEGADNLAMGLQTHDGGHVMLGRSVESRGNTDFYLVKTNTSDSSGCQEEWRLLSTNAQSLTVSEFPDSSFTISSTLMDIPTQVNTVNMQNQRECSGCDAPHASFHFTQTGPGETYQFADSSRYTKDYKWYFGDDSISTQQNPTHSYPNNGTYKVCLEVSNRCGKDSTCKTIQATSGISEHEKGQINFYPNPVKTQINMDWTGFYGQIEQIAVTNSQGRLIHKQPVQESVSKVNTTDWPEGLYMVEVITQKGKLTKKVMVH